MLDELSQHGLGCFYWEALPLMIDSDQPRHVRTLTDDRRLDVADCLAGSGRWDKCSYSRWSRKAAPAGAGQRADFALPSL